MAQEEQVLVIKRSVYEELGPFRGLKFDVNGHLEKIFASDSARFMPRSQAEQDKNFKQIIPYVIMTCEGKYLNYVRGKRAGETRLVGNRSIGIGGHINPADDLPLFNVDYYEAYLSAVKREVEEEVLVESKFSNRIVALLNDDTNEVGQVHLGVVHYRILDEPKVTRREQMITQMTFMSPAELREVQDSLETWSQLCLSELETIAEGV